MKQTEDKTQCPFREEIHNIIQEMITDERLNHTITSIVGGLLKDKNFAKNTDEFKYTHLIITGIAISRIIENLLEKEFTKELVIEQLQEQDVDCYEAEADDGSYCYVMASKGIDIDNETIEEHVKQSGKTWSGKYRKLSEEETKEQIEFIKGKLQGGEEE